MNNLVSATNLAYITAALAIISFVVYMIRKQEGTALITDSVIKHENMPQPFISEANIETNELPSFPNIPQEALDFYDKQREKQSNLELLEKNVPALNKTEYLILWLLRHGKADGKIKRKGTVTAFNQDWDLDLTLDLEKTKQTQQPKPRPETKSTGEELLF